MKQIERYDKIDILFFERPLVDLKRFAFKIAKYLKEFDGDLQLGAICIELPEQPNGTHIDHFYHRNSIGDIDEFLLQSQVKMLVFSNSRIPDLEMILHAKKLHIKTVILQEGIIFDGANINDVTLYNVFATLRFLPKAISYIGIIRRMCMYDGRSFIKMMMKIMRLRKGITHIVADTFSERLICDYVLTMGEHWKDYYIQRGYRTDQICLIGDHDLDDYEAEKEGASEAAICYIATVLVEDGTVKRGQFIEFVKTMGENISKDTKLYVKLHPRSDKSLYESLNDHNITYIRQGKLPSVNLYIGHHSTLLGRALYESDNLILWHFPREIGSFYDQFATAVCRNASEFTKALQEVDIHTHTNAKAAAISEIYWKNPRGAIYSAAEFIHSYYARVDTETGEKG